MKSGYGEIVIYDAEDSKVEPRISRQFKMKVSA